MFKVHINDETTELPEDDVFYIVAKEGIFLRKKLGVMDSIAPVDKISTLKSIAASARMDIKKIPSSTFAKIVDFFKKVYNAHHSEAVVLLFYQKENQKYRIVPPYQKVTAAAVDYNRGISLEGWDMIGTIHSHAAMSAFHSGTDQGDEETFDGLHITIGNVGQEEFSISASIVANGFRVIVDPEEYVNGIVKVKDIDETTPHYTTRIYKYIDGKMQLDEDASKKYITSHRKYDKRYKCTAPPSKSSCNPKWLKVVEKGTYTYSWKNRPHHNSNNRRGVNPSYGYGYGYDYGYGHHYNPHAWREHAGFLSKTKTQNQHGMGPTSQQIKNQFIIDNSDIDENDLCPCLSCKHRDEKILLEEDDTMDELIYICTKCDGVYPEESLEEDPDQALICPKCKTDEHFSLLDDSDLKDNHEPLTSRQAYESQPDQEGFFSCKSCGTSFLKLSSDVECPFCKVSLIESKEESLIAQASKDSGSLLEVSEEENQEILKQAAEADKNLERIPDPEIESTPLSWMSAMRKVFGRKN